jgi:hypothetical protein
MHAMTPKKIVIKQYQTSWNLSKDAKELLNHRTT